jgi:hypothetical protein
MDTEDRLLEPAAKLTDPFLPEGTGRPAAPAAMGRLELLVLRETTSREAEAEDVRELLLTEERLSSSSSNSTSLFTEALGRRERLLLDLAEDK